MVKVVGTRVVTVEEGSGQILLCVEGRTEPLEMGLASGLKKNQNSRTASVQLE
jgi:hypothetical protein